MRLVITYTLVTLIIITAFLSCKKDNSDSRTFEFDFSKGSEGWDAFFSDYPPNSESFYELSFGQSTLPAPLNNSGALRISGNNHSDDLFSAIYKKIDNLLPTTIYNVSFSIDLASKVASHSVGIGGSPDLMLGAGGISFSPTNSIDQQNHYRPNFESRIQSGLPNSVLDTLGRIGVSQNTTEYTLINRNNLSHKISLRTNASGELWLLIGTDSGFEGITTLYYSKIIVKIER